MGYYTRYELSLEDQKGAARNVEYQDQRESFEQWIESDPNEFCSYSIKDFVEGNADSCKWYDHEEDLLRLSTMFPALVFKLEGHGEETGDMWFKYFKNGKLQRCPAKVTYDEYDENKLEVPKTTKASLRN